MLQLHALLQHAGQFGIGLEQRAESLLGFSLLSEGVTLAYHQLFMMIGLMYLGLIVMVWFLKTRRAPERSAPVAAPIEAAAATTSPTSNTQLTLPLWNRG